MTLQKFGDGRDWFFEKRFGLFIHWGIYAVNAWHEQEVYRRMLPRARYAAAMTRFNPAGFDPDGWIGRGNPPAWNMSVSPQSILTVSACGIPP